MHQLSVHLFGKFEVMCQEGISFALDSTKVQELFCYLLFYSKRSHHRESLADKFWGINCTHQAKKYLRKAIWQLQMALDPLNFPENPPFLLVDSEWIQLNPKANIWADTQQFSDLYQMVSNVAGSKLEYDKAQLLKCVIQLYRGDLLEGWYQDWCLLERERLQNMFINMLWKLMQHCEAHQEYEEGLMYGMRVLSLDRAQEQVHHQLMRLYYLSGDRVRALRQYQKCVSSLREELGVDPSQTTQQLYKQIQNDSLIDWSKDGSFPNVSAYYPLKTEVELHYLKKVCHDLEGIQQQLQKTINQVESAIFP